MCYTRLITDRCLVSRDKKDYIDFSSNDYFGYSQDPELLEKLTKKMDTIWSDRSRLLGGDYQLIHEIEKAPCKSSP